MMKVNIIGAGILGISLGILLIEQGYEVDIFEKKLYSGGSFIPFKNEELYDYKIQYSDISLEYLEKYRYTIFKEIKFKKIKIYKYIQLKNKGKIELKLGRENIEKVFYSNCKNNDAEIVKYIFECVDTLHEFKENKKDLKEKKFLDRIKKLFSRKKEDIKDYKKKSVEDVIDMIESDELREIIKSLANKKASYMYLLDILYKISYSEIFVFDEDIRDIILKLEKKFLDKGGKIEYNSKVKIINSGEKETVISVNGEKKYCEKIIIASSNISDIVDILDEKYSMDKLEKVISNSIIYDSYVIVNLVLKKSFNRFEGINRFVAVEPFVDNVGAFHRKYEIYGKEINGKQNVSIYIRGNFAYWSKIDKYKLIDENLSKTLVSRLIIEEVSKKVPDIKDNIENAYVITPYEVYKENNLFIGSVRGIIPTSDNYGKIVNLIDKDSSIKCFEIKLDSKAFLEKIFENIELLLS
ncbi:NAD(P)-binding protein [uncultured Clostridium sp.]|uniref:NAD(P)-binding protein n=1 Tax=uncultured Clostridium sp. TaxID=59620 RepID=UPI0026367917|nr:NAD(P)-binding protein [uncultured Clostridium sp.]